MEIVPFNAISVIQPGESIETQMSIKFSSVSNAAKFEIWYFGHVHNLIPFLAPNKELLMSPFPQTSEILSEQARYHWKNSQRVKVRSFMAIIAMD